MQTLIQTAVVDPIWAVLVRVMDTLPSVLWAIILVCVGVLVAKLLREGIEKVLKAGKIDVWMEKASVGKLLEHLGLGSSFVRIVGVLVWWFIFLVFFIAAANALELNVVSQLLNRLVLFLPQVIAAVFILGVGIYVSTVVREIVLNTCTANHVKGAPTVAKLARAAVVAYAAFMALEQLGIARTITTSTLQIILASVGLAFGLAFGLGGRDAAAEALKGLLKKE